MKVTKENLNKPSEAANIKFINVEPNQEQYTDLVESPLFAGVSNLAEFKITFYLYAYMKLLKSME